MEKQRKYICIDLKTFYASVECVERKLDPLKNNLVVADSSRTDKTICLAVTSSLKKYGISGRARLFEVKQSVERINKDRLRNNKYKPFKGESYKDEELQKDPSKKLSFIIAPPRMGLYIKYSTLIYGIYLKFVAKEDIHVYSIDEVFIDITNYLFAYKRTPKELAMMMIKDVFETTGITATVGIGTNMFLAKVAMDIVAKKVEPDENGMRIAELDEYTYRKTLWNHLPLTDFWRIGPGIQKRLNSMGLKTMGEIARFSIKNEDLLYDVFGINAELIIDHAWGYEPATIKDVLSYKPINRSISSGQVLHEPYNASDALLIVKEMADQISLDLVEKNLCTNLIGLYIGYDTSNDLENYQGEVVVDYLGRMVAKPSHSSIRLNIYTSSTKVIVDSLVKLYKKIVDKTLLIRRINISCSTINRIDSKNSKQTFEQLSFFDETPNLESLEEENIQKAILKIKNKYGKNSIVRGMNLEEKGTMIERNSQIGGHKA